MLNKLSWIAITLLAITWLALIGAGMFFTGCEGNGGPAVSEDSIVLNKANQGKGKKAIELTPVGEQSAALLECGFDWRSGSIDILMDGSGVPKHFENCEAPILKSAMFMTGGEVRDSAGVVIDSTAWADADHYAVLDFYEFFYNEDGFILEESFDGGSTWYKVGERGPSEGISIILPSGLYQTWTRIQFVPLAPAKTYTRWRIKAFKGDPETCYSESPYSQWIYKEELQWRK